MDFEKFFTEFRKHITGLNPKNLAVIAAGVVVIGIILLSFTFILPILVIGAALAIIAFAIYIVYKFLGGK